MAKTGSRSRTFNLNYAAHFGDAVVTVPDQISADQRAFAMADAAFHAIRADGSRVRVRIDAEATGLFTAGTGDLVVIAARRGAPAQGFLRAE